jgi:hypothetical protein
MKAHRKMAGLLGLATLATGIATMLGGCAFTDPYERPGVWRPNGANDLNRELQVARPTDLVQGRGTTDSDASTASAAVDRMVHDRVRALQDIDISGIGSSSGSSGGGSGSSGSSGSGN